MVTDHGFGSPTDQGGVDSGFGSPSIWAGQESFDLGFGSPSVDVTWALVVAPPLGAWADEGGELVTLRSTWTDPGPYRVRLVDADGNLYPAAGNCYSGVMGQGDACYPPASRDVLRFVTPPAPPGRYSIRIRFGANEEDELVLVNALRVQARMRAPATYRLRGRIPSRLPTGPRLLQLEPMVS